MSGFQFCDGLGDGREDEVAALFTVFGKPDTGGGPVTPATERTGDFVNVHPALGSEADP